MSSLAWVLLENKGLLDSYPSKVAGPAGKWMVRGIICHLWLVGFLVLLLLLLVLLVSIFYYCCYCGCYYYFIIIVVDCYYHYDYYGDKDDNIDSNYHY